MAAMYVLMVLAQPLWPYDWPYGAQSTGVSFTTNLNLLSEYLSWAKYTVICAALL